MQLELKGFIIQFFGYPQFKQKINLILYFHHHILVCQKPKPIIAWFFMKNDWAGNRKYEAQNTLEDSRQISWPNKQTLLRQCSIERGFLKWCSL